MSDAPWRAAPDGIVVACRLTPKGGRDAIDGAATLADGTRVLLVRVSTSLLSSLLPSLLMESIRVCHSFMCARASFHV